MIRYRVVEYLNSYESPEYKIQSRTFLLWWTLTDGWGAADTFSSKEQAINEVKRLVEKDQRRARVRAYGSKIVYGPYPP